MDSLGRSRSSGALRNVIKTNRPPSSTSGDPAKVDTAMTAAAKTVSATYEQPFIKHAPIGAYTAVADVKKDGTTTVWTHSAQSSGLRAHLAFMLGVPVEKVTVRWLEGPGQYGRVTLWR